MSEYDVKHIILSWKTTAAGCDHFPAHLGKQYFNGYVNTIDL